MDENKTIDTAITNEPIQDSNIDASHQDKVEEQPIDNAVEKPEEDKLSKENKSSNKKGQAPKEDVKIDFDNLDDATKNDFLDKIDPETLMKTITSKRKQLSPEQSEEFANIILEKNQQECFNGKDEQYKEFIKNAPNFYLEEKAFYDKQLDNVGIDVEERFDKDGNLTKIALASIVNVMALQQRQVQKFTKGDKIFTGNISNEEPIHTLPANYHLLDRAERDKIRQQKWESKNNN